MSPEICTNMSFLLFHHPTLTSFLLSAVLNSPTKELI